MVGSGISFQNSKNNFTNRDMMMSEDFNACVKAQLLTYLPMAFETVLQKHEDVITQDCTIRDKAGAVDVPATMKATYEQQKTAKAVIAHLEALIKLARMVIDDTDINETADDDKQRLIDIIHKAQERINMTRAQMEGCDE